MSLTLLHLSSKIPAIRHSIQECEGSKSVNSFIDNLILVCVGGGDCHRAGDPEHVGHEVVDPVPGGVVALPPGTDTAQQDGVGEDPQELVRLSRHPGVVITVITGS